MDREVVYPKWIVLLFPYLWKGKKWQIGDLFASLADLDKCDFYFTGVRVSPVSFEGRGADAEVGDAGRVGTAPTYSTQTWGCGSWETAWRHRNPLIAAAQSAKPTRRVWALCSPAGNPALGSGSGDLQYFFCKKLLKSRSAPNAELISACRATHCCQQRLWGILKHSWYLLVNHLVIIYRKEEKRAQGTSSFQPGASSSETKGKTPEICHQNLPMTGLGFKVGMGELGRLNWDLIYMEKVRWKGRLLPQTLKHKWRSEYKKRFLGNHHGLKIELFLSTGVPVLRTVW